MLPSGKKKLTVEREVYSYIATRPTRTPKNVINVTIQLPNGKYKAFKFKSKLWTAKHDLEDWCTPEGFENHNEFTPRHAGAIIAALTSNGGKLPEDFDLDTWALIKA